MARESVGFVVPGDLESRTGGYGYDRRMIAGLRARGWSVDVLPLDASFPCPTPDALREAARTLAAIPDGRTVVIDGLALGAMPNEVEREAERLWCVALVHHPLAAEPGIDPATVIELTNSEKRALAAVRQVVVTSQATARTLAAYGVASDRILVVEPGTDPAPPARGSSGGPLQLLYVATLIPRKNHLGLLDALASIPNHRWRLVCAGSLDRDRATADAVRDRLRRDGLEDRVRLVGELGEADVASCYDSADLFVFPTLYEGYGMAVAEALARGLPVVATAAGAIPDLVLGEAGTGEEAGIVVPPGDVKRLADALALMLDDHRARERFRQGALRARRRLPTWDQASERMAVGLGRRAQAAALRDRP